MKLNGISELADICAVFVTDAEFSVLHAEYGNAEGKCCFGLVHAVHIAVQRFFLCFGQVHGVHECLRFAVIRFFRFETVYGICGKCFVIVGRIKRDSFHLSAVIIQTVPRFPVSDEFFKILSQIFPYTIISDKSKDFTFITDDK